MTNEEKKKLLEQEQTSVGKFLRKGITMVSNAAAEMSLEVTDDAILKVGADVGSRLHMSIKSAMNPRSSGRGGSGKKYSPLELGEQMPFGKYKGTVIRDLPADYMDYCQKNLKEKFAAEVWEHFSNPAAATEEDAGFPF